MTLGPKARHRPTDPRTKSRAAFPRGAHLCQGAESQGDAAPQLSPGAPGGAVAALRGSKCRGGAGVDLGCTGGTRNSWSLKTPLPPQNDRRESRALSCAHEHSVHSKANALTFSSRSDFSVGCCFEGPARIGNEVAVLTASGHK